MRIAIIGTGHLGSIHAKLAGQHPDVSLAAIVDPDQARGSMIAEQYGASWYAAVEEMPDLDAVIIASPTSTHYDVATQCLERGMHCFIEKPATATYEQAQALLRRLEQSPLIVQVGHVERFNPAVRMLAHMQMDPIFIEVHRLAPFKPRAIDVSVIHDLMIHDIDLLLWMTRSSVSDVQATGVSVLTDTIDICNARITFTNGCVANVTSSRITAAPMRKLRIFQRDRYVSLDLANASAEMYRLLDASALEPAHQIPLGVITTQFGDKVIVHERPEISPTNAIFEEQRAFFDSILSRQPVAVSLVEGAEAIRIAESIARLAR
ncbi:MAG: Gfo/Idh/MocA family oxidoreductase [Candidatus Kapabacteria bacterium]|nr:Gfo/Idh/MocA family oxidoreductase [Candidatus Kapabacteria bacterium]